MVYVDLPKGINGPQFFAGFFPVPSMLLQTTIQKPSIFEGLIISTHMKNVEIVQYLHHESCLLEHVLEPPKH